MGLEDAKDISVSGITANRVHMEIISSNLANINTTRTETGGAYRRKIPVFGEKQISFQEALDGARSKISGGIEIKEIAEDQSPLPKVYNPGHPDADNEGYVTLPNVSMAKEMVDMVYVSKVYEANITAYNATRKMQSDILQIQ
jgi:flagellar basal-body rod protein FlgC